MVDLALAIEVTSHQTQERTKMDQILIENFTQV